MSTYGSLQVLKNRLDIVKHARNLDGFYLAPTYGARALKLPSRYNRHMINHHQSSDACTDEPQLS